MIRRLLQELGILSAIDEPWCVRCGWTAALHPMYDGVQLCRNRDCWRYGRPAAAVL